MALLAADSMRAKAPTNNGEARLVPPTCSVCPSMMIKAPVDDAASNARSGPTRLVELETADCQEGAVSYRLVPPPVAHRRWLLSPWLGAMAERPSFHTVSPDHVVPLVESVVPPTWMTYGELAGSLTEQWVRSI